MSVDNSSMRQNQFYKIDSPKNFAKSTGKHQCWCLLLNRSASWRPETYLKRDPSTDVSLYITQNFKNTPFVEHLKMAARDFISYYKILQLSISGRILESKGMHVIFQKKGKKGEKKL